MLLSVVIITCNAGQYLEKCLKSVAILSQDIVIVDSGSTDNTIDIAKHYSARVIHQTWLGFGPQKQFAVSQANNNWVLCLDADEWLSDSLTKEINRLMASPQGYAYRFARCNRFMGRFLKHGEGYPDWSLRLFHRHYANWSEDLVHEYVQTEQPIYSLSGSLMHESGENIEHYLTKQNRYTSLQAQHLLQLGKQATLVRLLLSPLLRFIKFYFVRRGFMDGLPGLIHIIIGCFNSYLKYAKLLDLQRLQNEDKHKNKR